MSIQDIAEFLRSFWVVWLGLLFLALVAWALWPKNRKKFEHAARIPLEDDTDDDQPTRKGRD